MKKLLLYFVKFVNNYTNDKLSPDQEAESILNLLIWKSDISHTLAVNEALQIKIKSKMLGTKESYLSVISKIDDTYLDSSKIIHHLNEN